MGLFSVFTTNSGVVESEKLLEEYGRIITEYEQIEVGFKLNADTFIFTNKRLLFVKVSKGETNGVEYISLPYSNISTFSVVSPKSFDPKGVLKIWIEGEPQIKVEREFNKSVDVYEVQKLLAKHVLK